MKFIPTYYLIILLRQLSSDRPFDTICSVCIFPLKFPDIQILPHPLSSELPAPDKSVNTPHIHNSLLFSDITPEFFSPVPSYFLHNPHFTNTFLIMFFIFRFLLTISESVVMRFK